MTDLIAEDLLLLLLDDERGTAASLWVDVGTPLAAAALAELALRGAVELEPGSFLSSATLRATGRPEPDPVLGRVLAVVAERPRSVSSVISRAKRGLQEDLAARLAAAGVLRREEDRVLGLFPRTTWPEVDAAREQGVRGRLMRVLVDGAEPDERTAVLAGILGALDRVPQTLGLRGRAAGDAKRRATAIAKGDWAVEAVSAAMQAMLVAVMTPVIVTTVTS
ncbi:GOLPH3/VPS74 family protein [Amnibacterium endophyticum]|uniref:GPP34 family phosphoprotein n=1 Tax=Amnibacterium endophyticum TaxID=2109337 RepID=A0ABW4LDG8_9MICO